MAIPPLPPGAIPPLPPLGGPATAGSAQPAPPGFADAMQRGLQEVSNLEAGADRAVAEVATGGATHLHELMIATTKASLGVDLLVAVRNRAVEAYQEIMRLQV